MITALRIIKIPTQMLEKIRSFFLLILEKTMARIKPRTALPQRFAETTVPIC